MKKSTVYIFSVIVFLCSFIAVTALNGDQIKLGDGSTIEGKIIRVTKDAVEYDPKGPRPFDMMPRDQVIKIIYDDGTSVDLDTPSTSTFTNETDNNIQPSAETAPEKNSNNNDLIIKMKTHQEERAYIWFVGPEWGLNNYVGLGARFEFPIPAVRTLSINCGLGFGLWGGISRIGGGLRYYFSEYPFGSAIGIGASVTDGAEDQKMDMEVRDSTGNTEKKEMNINYKTIYVLNLTYIYSWNIYNDNKIYIEAGYGLRLSDSEDNYEINDPDDPDARVTLSQDAKDYMEYLQPGGFIFAIGMAF